MTIERDAPQAVPLSQSSFRPCMGAFPAPTSVFVSSRTDELRLERGAATAAILTAGLTAYSFDAALNKLSDSSLIDRQAVKPLGAAEPQERRISGKRSLRNQVDALIDGSDFFVGIYMKTAGHQEYSTGWLTWVEYELYRFLLRQLNIEGHGLKRVIGDFAEFHPWRALNEAEARKLNDSVRSTDAIADLKATLARAAAGSEDSEAMRVRAVLRSRTLLYQKRTREDNPQLSYDLQEFLLPLRPHIREIRTTVSESRDNMGDYHYFPAHAHLFEAVLDQLPSEAQTPVEPSINESGISLTITRNGPSNPRGILYPVLRDIFQNGLSVKQLFVGAGTGNDSGSGIRCLCCPTSDSVAPQAVVETLRSRLANLTVNHPSLELKIEEGARIPSPPRRTGTSLPLHSYRIGVIDSPGSLWAICTLIAAYGGSIVYLHHDDTNTPGNSKKRLSGREVSLDITFDIPQDSSGHLAVGIGRTETFEYQLRSLQVVSQIERL